MIQLADEFFSTRNDPEQLDVNQDIMEQLQKIHPATLSEEVEGDGPVVWILMIPTSALTMRRFIAGEINESDVLTETKPGTAYDAIYLCSALVLPEFRKQGRAFRQAAGAIAHIRKSHPIKFLYAWGFSKEGEQLAQKLAADAQLPLLSKPANHG